MTLILTCNPKTKRDPNIETYIGQIKNQYPSVEKVETMFKEFHALLFGKDETKLDEYLEKYSESKIESFCKGIKKEMCIRDRDITGGALSIQNYVIFQKKR